VFVKRNDVQGTRRAERQRDSASSPAITPLVGGLTREPSTDDQEDAGAPQWYLFIEATAKQEVPA
jgi:hypothetical protein